MVKRDTYLGEAGRLDENERRVCHIAPNRHTIAVFGDYYFGTILTDKECKSWQDRGWFLCFYRTLLYPSNSSFHGHPILI